MAYFASKHRVVALDLAGHGQSGGGRKDWTMAAFGEDVVSVVEALGLKRVVLIGHSLGGPAVLEAARRMPGRLAGLVLVDSWVDFEQRLPAEEVEKYVSALQADYRATTTAIVSQYLVLGEHARARQSARAGNVAVGAAGDWRGRHPLQHGLRAAAGAARDQGPHLRHQLRPVSHQLGGQPQVCPQLPGGDHEGSGALPHAEQPEAFNELLAWALRELARSGGGR